MTVESDVWIKLVDAEATLHVGEKSFLGRGTELDVLDRVTIGEKVLIAPRVFITDHSHKTDPGSAIMQQGCEARSVTIGDDVWIGTGAVILAGVTIGDGAVVGAGAVVRHDVPGNEIWAGVPAKKIRNRKGDVT
ncbi:MAG: acyltransferase [Planctomycetota bacterium]